MNNNTQAEAFYSPPLSVEAANKKLQLSVPESGTPLISGRAYHADGEVVAYDNVNERMIACEDSDAYWNVFLGVAIGSIFFWIPSLRPFFVIGLLLFGLGLSGHGQAPFKAVV